MITNTNINNCQSLWNELTNKQIDKNTACSINSCIKSYRHCNVFLKRLITRLIRTSRKEIKIPMRNKSVICSPFLKSETLLPFSTRLTILQHHSKTDNQFVFSSDSQKHKEKELKGKKSMILF